MTRSPLMALVLQQLLLASLLLASASADASDMASAEAASAVPAASVAAALQASTSEDGYALVADAGSTGTRMYLFQLSHLDDANRRGDEASATEDGGAGAGDANIDGRPLPKVQVTDLGKGPALSSFQSAPQQAADAVRAQLEKAAQMIPEAHRTKVPVSVLATAGMRLVPQADQDAIYEGLRSSLLGDVGGYPFDPEGLEARTITGREEGVFALVAANFLARSLRLRSASASSDIGSASMELFRHSGLLGVLDLGGSSTQVASPPTTGDPSLVRSLASDKHTFVRSFLKLGMERMRQRTFERFVQSSHPVVRERRAASNPCSFFGYTEPGEAWRGTGDAVSCERTISELVREEQASCAASGDPSQCLTANPVPVPSKVSASDADSDARFFLISGFLYVTDFARWWLHQPNVWTSEVSVLRRGPEAFSEPTINELREAASVLCAEPWSNLTAVALDPARKHRFTPPHKAPHRCFELNYITALLSTGYGFGADDRLFRIVEDIDGREIDWSLGAFLHGLSIQGDREPPVKEL